MSLPDRCPKAQPFDAFLRGLVAAPWWRGGRFRRSVICRGCKEIVGTERPLLRGP